MTYSGLQISIKDAYRQSKFCKNYDRMRMDQDCSYSYEGPFLYCEVIKGSLTVPGYLGYRILVFLFPSFCFFFIPWFHPAPFLHMEFCRCHFPKEIRICYGAIAGIRVLYDFPKSLGNIMEDHWCAFCSKRLLWFYLQICKVVIDNIFGFCIIGGYWSRRHIHATYFSEFSAMLDLSKGGC